MRQTFVQDAKKIRPSMQSCCVSERDSGDLLVVLPSLSDTFLILIVGPDQTMVTKRLRIGLHG